MNNNQVYKLVKNESTNKWVVIIMQLADTFVDKLSAVSECNRRNNLAQRLEAVEQSLKGE